MIDVYPREIATLARAVVATLRARLPGAVLLVYDGYNALAVGFGGTERAADTALSVAVYTSRVNLMFFHGATLPDPRHLLLGRGRRARHLTVADVRVLDQEDVRTLIVLQLDRVPAWDSRRRQRVVIRSESPRKRR